MGKYVVHGQEHTLTEWARLAGISRQAMSLRVKKAKSPEELEIALTSADFQGKSARKLAKKLKAEKVIRGIPR